jgi:hypothetical protein
MISIIGLPILLLFCGPREKTLPTSLRIFLPTDRKDVPGLIRFSRDYVYHSIKSKKIVAIDLDEKREFLNGETDILFYKRLQFISREIERLQFTNDTFTVLKIQLGDENTYGDFVWVFNQALLYRVKRFAFLDDAYFLFANPPNPPSWNISIDVPSTLIGDDRHTPRKWDIFKHALKEKITTALFIARQSRLYIAAFLLLIIIPGILWIRKNRSPDSAGLR